MTTAVQNFYAGLFKQASALPEVQRVKTAVGALGRFFAHPVTAYGLGATALGLGVPLAYGLGKQQAIRDAQALYGGPPPPVMNPFSVFGFAPEEENAPSGGELPNDAESWDPGMEIYLDEGNW